MSGIYQLIMLNQSNVNSNKAKLSLSKQYYTNVIPKIPSFYGCSLYDNPCLKVEG